ncbi:MAG TPA: sigma-54 dependent transcriptional regulator, partial [Isosphaeraceae bacterium]|nr:sigma-54 dependent transcriptional regulator [Isosphaeraceae bacterium]
MDKILLVEDDAFEQRAIAAFLTARGYSTLLASDGKSACQLLTQIPDIILLDLNLPGPDGLEVLREAHQVLPATPVIIMTGHGTVAGAVEAMKEGACDYLTKPLNPEELLLVIHRVAERSRLQREVHRLRQQVEERGSLSGMIGRSSPMRRIFDQIELVAPTRSTCLVTGESGTGKELVARAIHELSPRKDGPFIALNCAAIPKDLAESEMFGHAKGAFTGATDRRIGKFAAADRGTLLIDEIGEMELPVQAKLVRSLETRMINPVGANDERRVDVRVIAATHRNLASLVEEGKFREDLYFRLRVVRIHLPPLRERQEDIPLLVASFLQQLDQEHGRGVNEISVDAMDALQHNRWQGNVRELRNVLEAIIVLSRKVVIELMDLPLEIQRDQPRYAPVPFGPGNKLVDLERDAIGKCLSQTAGNRRRTAELLGISTRTLLRKIRKYRLESAPRPTKF